MTISAVAAVPTDNGTGQVAGRLQQPGDRDTSEDIVRAEVEICYSK